MRALQTSDVSIDIQDISFSGDFTVEAWVRLTPGETISNADGVVAGIATGADINFYNGRARVYDGTGDVVVANTPAVAGAWTHYAVTREAGVTRIYVNGALDATASGSWTGPFEISELAGSTGTGSLNGQLDEVRFWSVARTAAEIADNYNRTVDPASAGLARYYSFEGDSDFIVDATGAAEQEEELPLPAGAAFVTSSAPIVEPDQSAPISVTIQNPGFEAQALDDFEATSPIEGWDSSGGGMGVWNPRADFYSGEAPEGENIAYIDNGGAISQTLTETFEAGRSYRLAVKVGDEARAGENLGWEIRLYAGATLLGAVGNDEFNPPDDSFIDAVLTLDAADLDGFSADYGQPLRIELFDAVLTGENNAQFDDVRLDYVVGDTFDGGGEPAGTQRALSTTATPIDIQDLTLSGDFTIEAWMYFTPGQPITNADGLVAGPNNSLNFYQAGFRLYDGTGGINDVVVAATPATAGVWTHFAVTREDGVARIYVNGALDATSAISWTNDFVIEQLAGASAGALDGQIDEVQIWGVARSAAEIVADMDGADPPAANLLRYYNFDGTGDFIVDATGAAETGTDLPVPAGAALVASTAPIGVNAAPVFSSGATANVVEGATATGYVAAADDDDGPSPVVYSITGGADATLFSIDAATGALSFTSAPNFDAPGDADGDNVYEVTIGASDGEDVSTQDVAVTVTSADGPISVTILNAGFEAQILSDFQSVASIEDWDVSGGGIGVWNPRADYYSGEAPEGENVAYMNNGGTISQTLSETFEAGRSYQLSVRVGDESTAGESLGWEIRLYAGSTLLGSVGNDEFNPPDDSFIDAKLTLNATDIAAASAEYGQPLRIEIFDAEVAGENNAQFDDVRLDYVVADAYPGGPVDPAPGERALQLDDAAVTIPTLTLSGDFTIEAWLRLDAGISNADGLVSGPGNDLNFFEGNFRLYNGADVAIAATTATPGEWAHYAVTRENGVTRIYVDGELDATSTGVWTGDFIIEQLGGSISAGGSFDGQMDDVQIWNTARSGAEILSDLAGDVDPGDPDLARLYDFDGEAATIVDATGGSTDVALPAGASFVASTAPFEVDPPTGGGEGFVDTQVVNGLFLPTDLAFLPDGRMIVIEKTGVARIVDDPTQPGGDVGVYLDITAQTLNTEERGLLAVEVDPNFDENGYVYFFYTNSDEQRTTVSRFTHVENAGGATSQLDPSSEVVLWQEFDQTSSCCHQGGGLSIAYEPIDENDPSPYKLYIVTSDEFSPANSQDLTHDDGKVHRVNLTDGSVPTDNPYYDPIAAANYTPQIDTSSAISTSAENLAIDPEGIIITIHSHGLRNGWRSSYDQESETLFIGEVGGNNNNTSTEDIHIAVAGADYGWPTYEGFFDDPTDPGNPIHSYPHLNGPGQGGEIQQGAGGASLTGGVVYRGDLFPTEFDGAYFYGDWVRNWIRYLEIDYSGERPVLVEDHFFKNATGQVLAFEEGPDGSLYYITTFQTGNVFTFQGAVNRITYEGGNAAPVGTGIVLDPGEETSPTAPYTVTFEADVTDPDGDALSYVWSFGDGDDLDGDGIGDTAVSTEANPSYTYNELGQYVVELVVTDAQGAATVFDSKVITIGNAPDPVITSIVEGGTYRAGELITLEGFADDVEDGLLDDGDLVWSTTYQLGAISRPGPVDGVPDQPGGVSFTTPDDGNLESALDGIAVFLTATDSDGLATTTRINLVAEKVEVFFDAPVENYTFVFDQRTETGDFSFDSIINFNHTIEAQETYVAGGFEYSFSHWEDDPANTSRIRDFVTPETGATFRPIYEVTGEVGQALSLDGTGKLNVPQLTLGADGADFTIETWLKLDGTIDNIDGIAGSGVFGAGNDINFFQGQIRLYSPGAGPNGSNDPIIANHVAQPGVWTHYAIVREGGVLSIYVDGELDATASTTWTGPFVVDYLGAVQDGGPDGEFDEWRAWSVARSEAEIDGARGVQLTGAEAGLERYYSFDGDLSDLTGNSATPALPGYAALVASTAPVGGLAEPVLSVSDATVAEGDAGTTLLTFTVTRDGDLSDEATVDFATADGTAEAGTDYVSQTGSLTFAAGETTKTVSVEISGDTDFEADETLQLSLSNAVGATIAGGTATGVIANDDPDDDLPLVYDAPGPMSFDGTAGSVQQLPHDAAYEIESGTVAFSFIAEDTNGAQGLFSKDASGYVGGGNHFVMFLEGGLLRARYQDGAAEVYLEFGGVQAGEEYEVAATFGPGGVGLWIDGALVASDDLTMDWRQNVEAIQWGGRGWASASGALGFDAPFEGVIADKQIYGVELTAPQILALAASSSASNDAPMAADDTATVAEDGAVTFDPTQNDTDPDGGVVTVSAIASRPANGSATIETDGTVTYAPAPNFFGTDSFEIEVTDGQGGFATSVVTVTVTPVNDDPTAVDDAAQTVVDASVAIDVLANDLDEDGDALTVASTTDGAFGTVSVNPDGTVTYMPNSGYIGSDSFTYTIDDQAGGATSTATVSVEVLAEPNVAPVAADDAVSVTEDGSVTFQPGDNDADDNGESITAFAIAAAPTNGTAVVNPDGTVTYAPAPNFFGTDSFEVTVTDGVGGFDASTVTVTVTPVNDPPVATDDVAATSGAPVIINVLANDTDADGDALTITAVTDGAQGTVVDNGDGTVTYTPDADASGEDAFSYTVSDGEVTDTATVAVTISDLPDPIYEALGERDFNGANSGVQELPHDAAYETPTGSIAFSFRAADLNGDQGLFVKDASGYAGGGNHFALYLNGSTLVARFQDGAAQEILQIPGIVAGQDHDVAVTFGPGGGDVWLDGAVVASTSLVMDWTQNVEFIQWGGRGWGSASGAAGFDAPFAGVIADRRIYDVELDAGQVAELFADGPPNGAPAAADDAVTVAEDSQITFDPRANDVDPEGDPLSVALEDGPANGAAIVNFDGTVTYTPAPDFFGTDAFTLRISDGKGGADVSTVTATVTPIEDDPAATDDAASTGIDVAVVIDVLANDTDADGDALSVASVGAAANGEASINPDGTVTYTPSAGFEGTDSFIYTVSDGDGPTGEATVTVSVADAPAFPTPVFEQTGVSAYGGSPGDVDEYDHDPALAIAAGTIAFSFIDEQPQNRLEGLVVKDASGFAGGGNHFAAYLERGDLMFRFQDGSSSSVFELQNVNVGQEYEVAAVFGPDGVAVWIDGALLGSDDSFVMNWETNAEHLQLGGLGWASQSGQSGFSDPFSGRLADVEIYGEALSEEQIALLAENSAFDFV